MLSRRVHAVPRDADESNETGVPRLRRRAQRAVLGERRLPLVVGDEVVELDEIEVVDLEALQGPADLVARFGVDALAGLRRDEEVVAVVPVVVVVFSLVLAVFA